VRGNSRVSGSAFNVRSSECFDDPAELDSPTELESDAVVDDPDGNELSPLELRLHIARKPVFLRGPSGDGGDGVAGVGGWVTFVGDLLLCGTANAATSFSIVGTRLDLRSYRNEISSVQEDT
jgi:hypothetical protein